MEHAPKEDKESKKTSKKRAAAALSSATFAVDSKGEATPLIPRRQTKLDRAIADLAVPRPVEPAEKPKRTTEIAENNDSETVITDSKQDTDPGEPVERSEATVADQNESTDQTDEQVDGSETDAIELSESREQEPAPARLYAGEVVLRLHDEDSPTEEEIPLHDLAEPVAVPTETDEDEPDQPQQPVPPVRPPVTWRTQPQQQHQQRINRPVTSSQNTSPPGNPNMPPAPPNTGTANKPPVSANANTYTPQPIYNTANTAPVAATPPVEVLNPNDPNALVTRRQMEDEIYYARKAAQNKGVLAGLLVGGGYEHFKHRRREKKQARLAREQDRKLQRSLENNAYLQSETDRLRNQPAETIAQPAAAATEKPKTRIEKLLPVKKRFEKKQDDQLEIPPEHHIETSAWHSIEVDNRTGKAVENPTFNYGREYRRERQKENIQKQQDLQSAAGEVALVAAAIGGIGSGSSDTSGSGPGAIPNASTRGTKKAGTDTPNQTDKPQPLSAQSAVQLLPWAIVLIVIIVILIVVLR